jgi:peptidoglycan/LPS O-acetylase OafA/YrhL
VREKIYFPNLNGLRAIGAFIVVACHLSLLKLMWGFHVNTWSPIPGKTGVALFFALSGFLITSLLFSEQKTTGTIRLKAFYYRRILRIWPLYYIILILGLFVFNQAPGLKIPVLSERMMHDLTWINLLSVIFIIPNFTHLFIPYTDQRWSIVVEEMFYLVQPALVRVLRNKYFLILVFVTILFSSELLSLAIKGLRLDRHVSPTIITAIQRQLEYLGCIATGCIFAAIYKKRQEWTKKFLFSRWVQIGVLIPLTILCYISFRKDDEAFFDLRIFSFLFSIVVLNAAVNSRTIFRLENPVLNFLGKISYGIYMYHMFCLGLAFLIVRRLMPGGLAQDIVYVVLGVGLTVLVSWLSFRYLESFFLQLGKHKKNRPKATAIASDNSLYPGPLPVVELHPGQ